MPEGPTIAAILALRLGLLALLYAFLGAVIWTVWRDLRATAERASKGVRPLGRLVVEDGGGSELRQGESFILYTVTAIGRDLSNTVVITDPAISSSHSLLSFREGQWWIEDLGSRNGTFVNGTRVTRPVVVSPGDLIGIGRVQMRLMQ